MDGLTYKNGSIKITNNFDVKTTKPLDVRLVVNEVENLIDGSIDSPYVGMVVNIAGTSDLYVYTGGFNVYGENGVGGIKGADAPRDDKGKPDKSYYGNWSKVSMMTVVEQFVFKEFYDEIRNHDETHFATVMGELLHNPSQGSLVNVDGTDEIYILIDPSNYTKPNAWLRVGGVSEQYSIPVMTGKLVDPNNTCDGNVHGAQGNPHNNFTQNDLHVLIDPDKSPDGFQSDIYYKAVEMVTTEMIDGLEDGIEERIENVEKTLEGRIDYLDGELKSRIEESKIDLRNNIDNVEQYFEKQVETLNDGITNVREESVSNLNELKSDFKQRLEQVEQDLRNEIDDVDNYHEYENYRLNTRVDDVEMRMDMSVHIINEKIREVLVRHNEDIEDTIDDLNRYVQKLKNLILHGKWIDDEGYKGLQGMQGHQSGGGDIHDPNDENLSTDGSFKGEIIDIEETLKSLHYISDWLETHHEEYDDLKKFSEDKIKKLEDDVAEINRILVESTPYPDEDEIVYTTTNGEPVNTTRISNLITNKNITYHEYFKGKGYGKIRFKESYLKENGIPSNLFVSCSTLRQVYLNTCVTSINDYVFQGCSSLENVYGLDNVKSLGDFSFAGTSIRYYKVEKDYKKVGDRAFNNCKKLETLIFEIETLNSENDTIVNKSNFDCFQNDQDYNWLTIYVPKGRVDDIRNLYPKIRKNIKPILGEYKHVDVIDLENKTKEDIDDALHYDVRTISNDGLVPSDSWKTVAVGDIPDGWTWKDFSDYGTVFENGDNRNENDKTSGKRRTLSEMLTLILFKTIQPTPTNPSTTFSYGNRTVLVGTNLPNRSALANTLTINRGSNNFGIVGNVNDKNYAGDPGDKNDENNPNIVFKVNSGESLGSQTVEKKYTITSTVKFPIGGVLLDNKGRESDPKKQYGGGTIEKSIDISAVYPIWINNGTEISEVLKYSNLVNYHVGETITVNIPSEDNATKQLLEIHVPKNVKITSLKQYNGVTKDYDIDWSVDNIGAIEYDNVSYDKYIRKITNDVTLGDTSYKITIKK